MNYSLAANLPTEFRLAVACCRWASAGGDRAAVVEGTRVVDWQRFVLVVERHRIEGLVWHSLTALDVSPPPQIAGVLAARARSIADHGLRVAAESARLLRRFEQDGIAPLFLKGLTLGKLAYNNPYLKMSWDLDILVALTDIPAACRTLNELGYRLVTPGPRDQHDLEAWHLRRKESVWFHAGNHLHLELHGRLAENPRVIPNLGTASRQQRVEIAPSIVLPTLAREELFAYLCVHGIGSGWHRLKWISDFAGLIDELPAPEIARLYRASQSLGAGRSAGQALILAHRLFDIHIGDDLEREIVRDRTTRFLVRIAMNYLVGRADQQDPTEIPRGTIMIHLSQLLLVPGLAGKLRELGRKAAELLRSARGRGRTQEGR